jgi:hypothetical protein
MPPADRAGVKLRHIDLFENGYRCWVFDRVRDAVSVWFDRQKGAITEQKEVWAYKQALNQKATGRRLSAPDRAELKLEQRRLGLDDARARSVHADFCAHLVRVVIQDGIVTPQELDDVGQMIGTLGLQWTDLPPEQLQSIQLAYAVMDIQRGKLPSVAGSNVNIRLQAGEIVHAIFEANLLDERVVRRDYVGGSSGFTFRLTKGVSYRLGGTRGRSVPVTAIVPVDEGNVILTSQRLMFMGRKKPFAYQWDQVVCAEPAADGIHLVFSGKNSTATLQYANRTYAEILAALFGHYMQ